MSFPPHSSHWSCSDEVRQLPASRLLMEAVQSAQAQDAAHHLYLRLSSFMSGTPFSVGWTPRGVQRWSGFGSSSLTSTEGHRNSFVCLSAPFVVLQPLRKETYREWQEGEAGSVGDSCPALRQSASLPLMGLIGRNVPPVPSTR